MIDKELRQEYHRRRMMREPQTPTCECGPRQRRALSTRWQSEFCYRCLNWLEVPLAGADTQLRPPHAGTVLLCEMRVVGDDPEADFQARLNRADKKVHPVMSEATDESNEAINDGWANVHDISCPYCNHRPRSYQMVSDLDWWIVCGGFEAGLYHSIHVSAPTPDEALAIWNRTGE